MAVSEELPKLDTGVRGELDTNFEELGADEGEAPTAIGLELVPGADEALKLLGMSRAPFEMVCISSRGRVMGSFEARRKTSDHS